MREEKAESLTRKIKPYIFIFRVCQVKCVSFFDFIWRSVFDRHIYTINLIKW